MLPSEEVKGTIVRKKLDGSLYVIWEVERGRFTLRDIHGNPGSEVIVHHIGSYFDTVPVQGETRFDRVVAFDVIEGPKDA